MKHIYICLTITNYNYRYVAPEYELWEKTDSEDMTCRKLSRDEALRMQWELVKAGAIREYNSNPFQPSISDCMVTYWARH